MISLFIAHRWLPKGRRRVIEIAPGIALTFVSCVAFGEVFGAYLSEFARSYVSTYADLASVMIALIFLYSMAAIFLYGGELNAAIMRARKAIATEVKPDAGPLRAPALVHAEKVPKNPP
jgi:membrane protein